MSIQKITQSEILTHGIKGLPTRPSTPSLYKGSILSAEELKEAFDKLPMLIAERFNALLDSAGLYDAEHPAESLAALIATDIEASHSLRDFFEDVKNGNLALYLAAGENGEGLADVLSSLRDAVERNKRYAISLAGDGDLLTDVLLEGDTLTLRRDASVGEILEEAKAYADAPTGSVSAGCTAPVSGGAVLRAIENFNKDQSERIRNLENAAKDILYTYPTVEATFSRLRAADNIFSNSALLKMGGAPMQRRNLFPEQSLFGFQNDDLSITWDDEEKVLILNGTLYASKSPVYIAPFSLLFPYKNYSGIIFHYSGSVSTDSAEINFVSDSTEPFMISFPSMEENRHVYVSLGGTKFSSVELRATEDTVFTDYRFNLLVAEGQAYPVYAPFDSRNHFCLPKKLTALGPNCWSGVGSLVGETFVSFKPNFFLKPGEYSFRFLAQSTSPTKMQVHFIQKDGRVSKIACTQNVVRDITLSLEEPLEEIRIYATTKPETSVGHTVRLKNIYIDYIGFDPIDTDVPFTPYHCDEITFPETFEQFSPLFLGWGDENCNYFDFELGCFVESYHSLTIDGSLQFEAVEGAPGRFSAPYPVPTAIQEDENEFRPSAIFFYETSVGKYETLCFSSDRVIIQSRLFVGKTADDVKYFLNLCPIDVVYKESKSQNHLVAKEDGLHFDLPTIRTNPHCHLYFSDAEDQMVDVFSQIQYQTKSEKEKTV